MKQNCLTSGSQPGQEKRPKNIHIIYFSLKNIKKQMLWQKKQSKTDSIFMTKKW